MAITSIKHKGLKELFQTGKTAKVSPQWKPKIEVILDALDAATATSDLAVLPGFHPLEPKKATQFAVAVSGNYRITFKWDGNDISGVQLEDYH